MARADDTELIDSFEEFYRSYYRNEIAELAQKYPNEQKSLYVDWQDLYRFDSDLADDFRNKPDQLREYAEEALRLYDLPVDVSLGQAHVRLRNLPETTDIRGIRSDHRGMLISVQGIIRKATDVRPKITTAAFECQRCGTLTRIPQEGGDFQEPHECQGCERQGPFRINYDQSEFIDAQKLRVQESPEGLRGGETPQNIDVNIEDDITGEVTPGDHVTATGILKLEQQGNDREKSAMFDVYMEGLTIDIEDEQFEEMEITDEDKKEIVELSNQPDIYEEMVGAIAPSIYGYEKEKKAMAFQLFSGVTKFLPDGSRTRGDLHILLVGDPGTGKCLKGDANVTLGDGQQKQIRELVEENLDDPKPVDDGVYDTVDIPVPSLTADGEIRQKRATKVWKREAPDQMYQITTASGKELEVTPSHPLFVQSEGRFVPEKAEELTEGDEVAVASERESNAVADGGTAVRAAQGGYGYQSEPETEPIKSIETINPDYDWVYDLEVSETHNYISEGVISHNSQLLQYIKEIAPRSVYTSGKGSSSAGLTAAAVRDDFGEGQQWTLEAGALVLADQGIAAVDELDKMRCVTGDTMVHTPDGITPIREFARRFEEDGSVEELKNGQTIRDIDARVWTMTERGEIVQRPVTAVHEYNAPETVLGVSLESGESVTATKDHPFFVLSDGEQTTKPASELEDGDWVYVPDSMEHTVADGGAQTAMPSGGSTARYSDAQVSAPRAAILGYIAGDGNIYYSREDGSYGIRFTNAEEELLSDFERNCSDAFEDADPARYPSEQRDDGVKTVRLHGKQYANTLLDCGLNIENYDGKRVPEPVTSASKAAKAAFIRALADSEGSVGERNVRISSSSYELLLGTKMLLLEFGITSQIQTREYETKRDLYVLAVTADESLRRFRDEIGFTLSRKAQALVSVCERTTGDRTILDVLPECGPLFEDARTTLRLHQAECGLVDSTYCNFENGDANCSLRAAKRVLETFEQRKKQAKTDLNTLSNPRSWEELTELRQQYHISQSELSEGTPYSQQQISRCWGDSDELKQSIRERLRSIIADVADASFTRLRSLINNDVKWRRVSNIESTTADVGEGQIRLQRHRLAELLDCPVDGAADRAESLLSTDPAASDWGELRAVLDAHAVSFGGLADRFDVAPSTISRWFNERVDGEDFTTVREVAFDLLNAKRDRIRQLSDSLAERQKPSVYDLTVEGTHNFVANGVVVHNSEDQSAMHEALEQQSYHPNSEVLLSDGRRVEIGELVDKRFEANPEQAVDGVDCEILPTDDIGVHTVDLESNEVTKTDVDRVSRHEAPEEFVRVTFSNGRDVLVTPEHPMFVDQAGEIGTVEASDIEKGAFVPAPRKLPNSAQPVEMDGEAHIGKEKDVELPDELSADLAEILGLLTAEGHSYAGSAHEIGFSNQDERLLDRFSRLMSDVFGMDSSDTTNAAGTVTQRYISTKLYRWFESNVPEVMHTARDKRMPAAVLGASEEIIRRFLVGAFAGDGGVESEAMSFSTASEGLAEDYADALAKIGVASRIHYTHHEDAWKTYVMGDSTEGFVEQVVEPADSRYEKARSFVDRSNETVRHHDVLPTGVATDLRKLRSLVGLPLTGKFRPNIDEGYGVQIETVESEIAAIRDQIETVRAELATAETVSEVRSTANWSGRELAEYLDGVTTSTIHYAEDGGYDEEKRQSLARRGKEAVEAALDEAQKRAADLEAKTELRYYRVQDVETVPNEDEYECEWVYDVTVEPTNTFVSQGVVLHNSISVSKAGINATLKSRCSLLGAANPTYGRFDEFEPIGEQIDLAPPLISRFDLIFTVTDQPDEEEDNELAEHILQTNYAGELNTHRTETSTSNYTKEEVERITDDVAPTIDAEFLRKYVAYAQRNCYPTMTEEAKSAIQEFYVELRMQGSDEDAPVPVTARKLEAMVRLAEASARVRLSDSVTEEDAQRAIEIARYSLEDIGLDPETGELDADMIETGTSKSQRDRIKNVLQLIESIEDEYDEGAPVDVVIERAEEEGMDTSKAEHEIDKLKQKGEVYEPRNNHLRTT